jgi:hypothetical protein
MLTLLQGKRVGESLFLGSAEEYAFHGHVIVGGILDQTRW